MTNQSNRQSPRSDHTPADPVSVDHLPDTAHVTDDPQSQAAWRKQVRAILLAHRRGMVDDDHKTASKKISENLATFLIERSGANVGFYWPIHGEVDVRPAIREHLARGGTASLPHVPGRHKPMVFHQWLPDTPMKKGFAGIAEPDGTPVTVPQVIVAPLVGFDRKGYRLGYGGGFFDRTLAQYRHRPIVVGIGFANACLPTIFPQPHDVPMDVLITEDGIFAVSERMTGMQTEEPVKCSSAPCYLDEVQDGLAGMNDGTPSSKR